MAEIAEQLLIKLTADVTGMRAQMDEIAGVVKKDNEAMIQSTHSLSAGFRSAMESAIGFWGAMEAKQAISALVDANIHMQQIQYTLQYATGSAAAAAKQMKFLASVSNSLGINLQEAGMQFARLLSASQGQAISIQTLQSLYVGLAKTFDILHASTASQQRVMQTFTEMMTMGTVHAQQLRMMLGRDLPGVNFIGIAAKELGVTTQRLNAMMKAGQLTATQLMPALAKGLNDAANKGTALQNAINGTNATLNRFHTAVFESESELSNEFMPAAAAATDQLTQILHTIIPLNPKLEENKNKFSGLREAVNGVVEAFLGIKAAFVSFFEVFTAAIKTIINNWVTFIQELEAGYRAVKDLVHGNVAGAKNEFQSMGSLAVEWGQNFKQVWTDAFHGIQTEIATTSSQLDKISSVGTAGKSSPIPNVAPGAIPGPSYDKGGGLEGKSQVDVASALNSYSRGFESHLRGGGGGFGHSTALVRELEKQQEAAFKQGNEAARRMAENQDRYAQSVKASWMQAMNPIGEAFGQTITGMIRGTQTLQGGLRNMFQSIAAEYLQLGIKMVETWIANEAAKTAATAIGETTRLAIKTTADKTSLLSSALTIGKEILMKMWNVMAGVYSAIAAIPYVGPFLAPAMAVAAGAEVASYASHVASAAGGYWDIPHDQMVSTHKNEMVLPPWGAQGLRDLISGGGGASGGGTHLHLHGVFDEGGMRRMFSDHSDALGETIQHLVRNGGLKR